MTIEQLIDDALHAADNFEPSPDLFAKVQRSIEEDAAHRRRLRRNLVLAGGGLILLFLFVMATVDIVDGSASMSFTSLEVFATAVMVVIVATLGPAIRRFGQFYEADAFGSDPAVGTQVLKLLDIAYFLIFGAYILMTLVFDPALEFEDSFPAWLRGEFVRVGGLLLLMGLLHVALTLALPVAGLVHSANERRRRISNGAVALDAVADRVDRYITVAAWIVGIVVVAQLVMGVIGLVLGGMSG